jgi:hypothetical protein
MSRDMTKISDTLSVTYDQGYKVGYPILFMSQMTRDMTRLTDIISVTNDQ